MISRSTPHLIRTPYTIALALFASGCQLLGGMRVEAVASGATPPGQVAAYVTVTDDDQAALQLDENNFHLLEDGKPLDAQQVQLRLLSRDVAVEHHVIVLVDLSGPIEDKGARSLLITQLAPFLERLRQQQNVSVYGYDGATDLVALGKFNKTVHGEAGGAPTAAQLGRLNDFKQRDPSSNLNGALVTAIHQLNATLLRSDKPVRLGSIIVIARGPDLAGRTPEDAVTDALGETQHKLYAVTFGKEDDQGLAERIGPDGYSRASLFENMETSLADVSRLLENDYNRYYLISYCSPARSGRRELTIQVERTNSDGGAKTAEAYVEFDSTGFRSGCDSGAVPHFISTPNSGVGPAAAAAAPTPTKATDAPSSSGEPAPAPTEVAPPPESGNYAL